MHNPDIVFYIFLIFTGAAVAATLALVARQSLLVAYIVLGAVLGPYGVGFIDEPEPIRQISHFGVIFLLYLLGLNLHPQKLLALIKETTFITLASSCIFGAVGLAVGLAFGFNWAEALVIGAAATFSSTIIGLKLLPTTALHHQHTGEVIISILLLQDLIAIVLLLVLQALGGEGGGLWGDLLKMAFALPALLGFAIGCAKWLLMPLFMRYDTIQEYLFLVAIGWCLGVAQLGHHLGLSHEIGAFIGGVALATSPISTFIAESLKPLRDFFLILFFFSLGATVDLSMAGEVLVPALLLAAVLLLVKPPVFERLLRKTGEGGRIAREIGVRLGQVSEFSLFVAVLAQETGLIGARASYLIQLATLATFLVSSYFIMLRYPTPIAVSARLRQD